MVVDKIWEAIEERFLDHHGKYQEILCSCVLEKENKIEILFNKFPLWFGSLITNRKLKAR